MKCDELKAETIVPQGCTITLQMYPKAEADAAIAELKDKCQMHDFFWEGCGFAKRGFKNTIAVSEAFDRLEAENAELKKKLMPCLNGDCILTCEVVEKYGKENTELKAENERLRDESCKLTDGCLRLKQCRKEKANIADELRHHKYKRCLAMAEWCEATALWCYQAANTLPAGFHATLYGKPVMIEPNRLFKRHALLTKWSARWRELAEQFKEAK